MTISYILCLLKNATPIAIIYTIEISIKKQKKHGINNRIFFYRELKKTERI